MHKNATKCNETLNKWYKNKHGASKIMDTLETYQESAAMAEALAMKYGLQLAWDIGCNRLIVKSDSTETIDACNGESRW
jgi:ribonuclease HI